MTLLDAHAPPALCARLRAITDREGVAPLARAWAALDVCDRVWLLGFTANGRGERFARELVGVVAHVCAVSLASRSARWRHSELTNGAVETLDRELMFFVLWGEGATKGKGAASWTADDFAAMIDWYPAEEWPIAEPLVVEASALVASLARAAYAVACGDMIALANALRAAVEGARLFDEHCLAFDRAGEWPTSANYWMSESMIRGVLNAWRATSRALSRYTCEDVAHAFEWRTNRERALEAGVFSVGEWIAWTEVGASQLEIAFWSTVEPLPVSPSGYAHLRREGWSERVARDVLSSRAELQSARTCEREAAAVAPATIGGAS